MKAKELLFNAKNELTDGNIEYRSNFINMTDRIVHNAVNSRTCPAAFGVR